MERTKGIYLALLAVALSPVAADADVVLVDTGAAASNSFRCAEDSGACNGTWTVFDDFELASAATITGIDWTTFLYGGLFDYNAATVWIYDADPVFSGGNLIASNTQFGSPTQNSTLGRSFYDITFTGLDISLEAGTYWLSIQHDTVSSYATVACTVSCVGNSTQWQNDGAGSRINDQKDYAFRIYGVTAVPEPSTIALLGLGLVGMAARRRKRV